MRTTVLATGTILAALCLHLAAAGKSDLASGRAMKTDDIFWIASMSKPMTAVAVARFYQMMLNQGELNGRRILNAATAAEMIRKQTGNLTARPGMPWGLGFSVVENPEAMEANKALSPNSFGHGGAYSTQSWADPGKGLVWVVMFQRNGRGNPDNSDVRIAFQNTVIGRDR